MPLRFILDDILPTHESIQWPIEPHQVSIFLKLEFNKAYDGVDWTFMFQVMEKLGMITSFINMIILLFQDATVSVNINSQMTKSFQLHIGVRQGCPLAPYLFIIVAEALNVAVKHTMRYRELKGITLPQCNS